MLAYLRRTVDAAFGTLALEPILRMSTGDNKEIHFLHIGKNAGTQIISLLRQINEADVGIRFICHNHDTLLRHLPKEAEYFFSVRDPVTRFRSSFYSRKRKGQPQYHKEWTRYERRAFEDFEHANDLAEALFEDGDRGHRAFCAISSIRHMARSQIDWFFEFGNLFDLRPPVYIVRQEHFELDFENLKRELNIDLATPVTGNPLSAHRNDYSNTPRLSKKAIANLRKWYCQDIEFYQQSEAWLEREKALAQ